MDSSTTPIYATILIGILCIALGVFINEKNAKYILSGYNTMSKEQQAKVNFKQLAKEFKNFHIFLGVSLSIIGIAIYCFLGERSCGIFITFHLLICYFIFFLLSATKKKPYKLSNFIAPIFILTILIYLLIDIL